MCITPFQLYYTKVDNEAEEVLDKGIQQTSDENTDEEEVTSVAVKHSYEFSLYWECL